MTPPPGASSSEKLAALILVFVGTSTLVMIVGVLVLSYLEKQVPDAFIGGIGLTIGGLLTALTTRPDPAKEKALPSPISAGPSGTVIVEAAAPPTEEPAP